MVEKLQELDSDMIRCTAAYHEAAHVVVAYYFGWWVNHEGVEIDEREYTGLRRLGFNNTESEIANVSLAGSLGELHWLGRGQESKNDENLIDVIDDVREECGDLDGDDSDVFKLLLENYPDETDEELIARYRVHERDTRDLVTDPENWQYIEKVAEALIEKGKLSTVDVEKIIDWTRPTFTDDTELADYVISYVDRFGENSATQAHMRANLLHSEGDYEDAVTWQKISIAICLKLAPDSGDVLC